MSPRNSGSVAHPGLLELLALTDAGGRSNPSRAVYVNRSLRMDYVEVIGFDMDYTLALYRDDAIEGLAVGSTVDKLVAMGYPAALRRIEYDRDFVIRGLVVDKRTGNLLKMDRHRHVGRVFHGFRRLDKAERQRSYRSERIRLGASRYRLIDTLFALPEAYLFAAIIDLLETKGSGDVDYPRIFDDIRACIDEAHRDGSMKEVVTRDLAQYIHQDGELALTLHKLRSAGKRLFLMTNSYFPYTNEVMRYLFDGVLPDYPSWRNYFDWIVVGASKPGFFSQSAPFVPLDTKGKVIRQRDDLPQRGGIYQEGNLVEFQRALGVRPDSVLYVGDHIYGDVLRAKKATAWRTAMTITEMEDEISGEQQLADRFRRLLRLEASQARLDQDLDYAQSVRRGLMKMVDGGAQSYPKVEQRALNDALKRAKRVVEAKRQALGLNLKEHRTLEHEVDSHFNAHWGPLFKEGAENSFFGSQVEDYACLYTSRVSNFLAYATNRYFRSPRDRMPHESVS